MAVRDEKGKYDVTRPKILRDSHLQESAGLKIESAKREEEKGEGTEAELNSLSR